MFCIHCGKENDENAKFCKYCGKGFDRIDDERANTQFSVNNKKWIYALCGALVCLLIVGVVIGISKKSDKENAHTESANLPKEENQKEQLTQKDDPVEVEEIIEFQDPLVERCVRATLGKGYDEEITGKDCESVTTLLIDCDLDMGISVNGATLSADIENYVDLCDLQYFTELEELIIDNNICRDFLFNLDAVKHCSKLKRLSIKYNPGSTAVGMVQLGYKYLAEIVKELPCLEYIDLGYEVVQGYQELIAGDNAKLVFDNSGKWLDISNGVGYAGASSVAEYVNSWQYSYDKWESEKELVLMAVSSYSELKEFVDALPTETEDIYVRYWSSDTVDMSIFTRFEYLKTLTINHSCEYFSDFSDNVAELINVEELASNKELFSLNLCGVTFDFTELKVLKQIRELSIYTCVVNSLEFLPELKQLRELTLLYNFMPSIEDFLMNDGSKMLNLRFLRVEDINTSTFEGINNIPGIETLFTLRSRNMSDFSFDAISKCETIQCLELDVRSSDVLELDKLANLRELKFLTLFPSGGYEDVSGVGNLLALPSLVSFTLDTRGLDRTDKYLDDLSGWIYLATQNPRLSFFTDGKRIDRFEFWDETNQRWVIMDWISQYEQYYMELYNAGILCGGFDYVMLREPKRYCDVEHIMSEIIR